MEKLTKTKVINIRLTEDEYKKLKEGSKYYNLSISDSYKFSFEFLYDNNKEKFKSIVEKKFNNKLTS